MTEIYLVRHAEAEGNLYRIVQGQLNSNLTERGWRQVEALGRRFLDIPIDKVYTSDLYRTCATASAIYKPKGLTPIRRKDLREIFVGAWEGTTWGEIARNEPENMYNFSHRPDLWTSEGAETPLELMERIDTAVRSIAAECDGQRIAIVSHGYAIRMLLAKLQGLPTERLGESKTGPNTGVTHLTWENGALKLHFRDDISHLQTPEYLAGEKGRRPPDPLEPGLWYRAPQGAEAGEIAAACGCTLMEGAETLVGWSHEKAVGVLQLLPGRVALCCVLPEYRNRGFGGQMLGQAVYRMRDRGEETLYAVGGEDCANFFRDYGFTRQGAEYEKDLRFLPEFLGEAE